MAIRNQVSVIMKKCIRCLIDKDLDEFQTRNRGSKIEYLSNCRICERLRIREWKQNKAKIKKNTELLSRLDEIPEGHKHCTNCIKVKTISEFGTRKNTKGQEILIKSWCRECEKDDQLERSRANGAIPRDTRQCRGCKESFPQDELNKTYYCVDCKVEELQEGFKRCTMCKKVKKLNKFSYRTAKGCKDPFPRSNCKICTKLVENPRSRILAALRSTNVKKSAHTIDLIGCSFQFLSEWLEWQFDEHMSWDNMGDYWHIDHVTPCASFNMAIEKEQFKCFNWENMRPLYKIENMEKHDKILPDVILNQENKVKEFKEFKEFKQT